MEDTDDQRDNEIVQMPTNHDEAHDMLNKVEGLLRNMKISGIGMSGNSGNGFGFTPPPGSTTPMT